MFAQYTYQSLFLKFFVANWHDGRGHNWVREVVCSSGRKGGLL